MDKTSWYYVDGGEPQGPVDIATIRCRIRDGLIGRDDLVWQEGTADWVTATEVVGLIPPPIPQPSVEPVALPQPTLPITDDREEVAIASPTTIEEYEASLADSNRNNKDKIIKCTECGLVNPKSGQQCDCGFDFQTGRMERSTLEHRHRRPSGIGGWLILPAIGLVLNPLIVAGSILLIVDILLDSALLPDIERQFPGAWAYMYSTVVVYTVFLIFQTYVAIKFFMRRSCVPKLMIAYLIFNTLQTTIFAIWASAVYGDPIEIPEIFKAVGIAGIWIAYFLVSKRVKNTFVNK